VAELCPASWRDSIEENGTESAKIARWVSACGTTHVLVCPFIPQKLRRFGWLGVALTLPVQLTRLSALRENEPVPVIGGYL